MITNNNHLVALICGDGILVIAKCSGAGKGGSADTQPTPPLLSISM